MNLMDKYRQQLAARHKGTPVGQPLVFDPSLYKTCQDRLRALFTHPDNDGRWFPREELRKIGGSEATKRIRDLAREEGLPLYKIHRGHSQYDYRYWSGAGKAEGDPVGED